MSGTLDAVDEAAPMESFSTAAFATHEPYPLPSEHMFRCGIEFLCNMQCLQGFAFVYVGVYVLLQRPASCIVCCIQGIAGGFSAGLACPALQGRACRFEQVCHFWDRRN
jgi:hypothetical protein